jgi:hypothetical protein
MRARFARHVVARARFASIRSRITGTSRASATGMKRVWKVLSVVIAFTLLNGAALWLRRCSATSRRPRIMFETESGDHGAIRAKVTATGLGPGDVVTTEANTPSSAVRRIL